MGGQWLPKGTERARTIMKVRESGMPEREVWATFFEPDQILARLGLDDPTANVVEFGCGYGTLTVAAAARTRGTVFALDIEPVMIEATRRKAHERGLTNVRLLLRDFVADGTGLADASVGCALLFNILHTDYPAALLREARRVLRPNGKAALIHWNYDPTTPRGPDLSIWPRPEQCQEWIREAGFSLALPIRPVAPYHYGLVGLKSPGSSP
jgi:SAM-dependent methyltransferase